MAIIILGNILLSASVWWFNFLIQFYQLQRILFTYRNNFNSWARVKSSKFSKRSKFYENGISLRKCLFSSQTLRNVCATNRKLSFDKFPSGRETVKSCHSAFNSWQVVWCAWLIIGTLVCLIIHVLNCDFMTTLSSPLGTAKTSPCNQKRH